MVCTAMVGKVRFTPSPEGSRGRWPHPHSQVLLTLRAKAGELANGTGPKRARGWRKMPVGGSWLLGLGREDPAERLSGLEG